MTELYTEWKVGSAAILLALTIICSMAPWQIRNKFKKSKLIMSYLNCLAGGVVLGALLMHMIPEMNHTHHHHHQHKKGHTEHQHALTQQGNSLSALSQPSPSSPIPIPLLDFNNAVLAQHANKGDKKKSGHGHSHGLPYGPFAAGCSFLLLLAIDRLFMHAHSHSHDHGHEHGSDKALDTKSKPIEDLQCSEMECGGKIHAAYPEDDDCASCHSEDLMGGCHMDGLDAQSSKAQAIVFVVALSLHSFLEGLGAASASSKAHLIMYLISLFGHKWLEAFALGVNVLNAKFSFLFASLLILLYSCLTPLGIILGLVFEKFTLNGPYADLTMKLLNGLAVGSFLFVACIEMIPPEFHKKTRHTPWKFLVLCVGFLAMAAVSLLHIH